MPKELISYFVLGDDNEEKSSNMNLDFLWYMKFTKCKLTFESGHLENWKLAKKHPREDFTSAWIINRTLLLVCTWSLIISYCQIIHYHYLSIWIKQHLDLLAPRQRTKSLSLQVHTSQLVRFYLLACTLSHFQPFHKRKTKYIFTYADNF